MDETEVNASLVAPDEAEKVEKDDNDSVETFESAIDNEEQNKYGETTASLDKDQNFIEEDLNLTNEPKPVEEVPDKLEEQVTATNDDNEMPEASSSEIVTTDVLLIKDQSFDEPMEQESSDKTSPNETINFTEKSIHISQINVSLNNDDSNDAFNALKESEEDALNTKEEPEEVKEEEIKEDEVKEKDSLEDEADVSMPIEQQEVAASEKAFDDLTSNDVNLEDNVDAVNSERQESVVDDAMDIDDKPLDEEQNEDNEAAEDDGGTTETTTEQEGVDENVCLLGDVEREITDADKERAVTTETPDDDEVEVEEAMAVDKDTETDAEVTEDTSTEKEVDEAADEQIDLEEATDTDVPVISQPLKENEIREIAGEITEQTCLNCENLAQCNYELLDDASEIKHLCTYNCVIEHCEDNAEKYFVTQKKVTILQIIPATQSCTKCNEEKSCKYRFRSSPRKSKPTVEEKSMETPAVEEAAVVAADETPAVEEATADVVDEATAEVVAATADEESITKEVASETSVTEEATTTTAAAETSANTVDEEIVYKYVCDDKCLENFVDKNTDKYTIKRKRHLIEEIVETEEDFKCFECAELKKSKYKCTQEDNTGAYICNEDCLNLLLKEHPDSYRVKRRSVRVRELPQRAKIPDEIEPPKIVARTDSEVECARLDRDQSFIRRCTQCCKIVEFTNKSVQWETFDFCDASCLGLYQNLIGATCTSCNNAVTLPCIGKFCVRFGFDLKQFCCSGCLDVYKKALKQCALCLLDLSLEQDILLAQCGEKNTYKDFCNQTCLKRYEEIINPKKKPTSHICAVCNNKKPARIEVQVDGGAYRLCSNPCFSAFKFVNNVVPDQCDMCMKYFERKQADSHTIYDGDSTKMFCTRICMNVFVSTSRTIWQCNWCRVSKYNYDMIQSDYGKDQMCSLNCLTLYEVSINALTRKRTKCAHCKIIKQPQYHLTMSDSSIRNFCTYQCVLGFQSQFNKKAIGDEPMVVPAGTAKRIKPAMASSFEESKLGNKQGVPIISRVQSLSSRQTSRLPYNPTVNRPRNQIPVPELTVQLERIGDLPARVKVSSLSSLTGGQASFTAIPTSPTRSLSPEVRVENKTQVVTIPPLPKQVSNVSTMCKAIMFNKAISCKVSTKTAECQTDDYLERTLFLPIPIPVFVPQPMMMYSAPVPVPVPFCLPIPCPVFIPTTRNSASGIMKEIKKIQEKMPTDPYEAELLMMAEMVAGDKKREETDSDSDNEVTNEIEYGDGIENNSSFNEDLVQMAFKMASGNDFDDPPVDLESEMTANTISQNTHPYDDMDPHSLHHHQLLLLQQQREAAAAAAAIQSGRGRKRMPAASKQINNNRNAAPNKRIKREMEVLQQDIPREPAEKPDANMCLKYTFGVNAWKQWVATKNADFEKSSIRRKPIKSEILQLTADELNYSLCMFVKEVRKPNGSEYAPDTIYYLVLGIQQYLYENGRIDNIFTDRYYEQFTDCLDEVAKKFSVLYNDSQYIVTRVEEEHLWECKQLGAHSPHVLLSTLMFFNTKHFNLVTVDEHMELSFSHIMKHWKRNPNQPGAAKMPGSRNVLLRFYPPQSSLEANSRKKKVYEQQENEDNPLRCPVKLYEFYLSKCPESVKTRNDVFYLQPERSCVPDSPVWYSTQPLSRDALSKMLHRVKMVKEINIALLTS